jgi:tRNA (guanine37-N1)-methyltransferase
VKPTKRADPIPLTFDIITIFPEYFSSPLSQGVVGKAIEAGLVGVRPVSLRDFTSDRHRTTDDRPYGGGAGMVMTPEPLPSAISALREERGSARVIVLSPRGKVFSHEMAGEIAELPHVILVCGRYEGVDERVTEKMVDQELSLGDYVLSGGEPAALVVIDAVSRLIPGVLGCANSASTDSFADSLLEHPHYSRPREFMGLCVPEVLLSGDHEKIAKWRRQESLRLTAERRPDLLEKAELDEKDREFLRRLSKAREDRKT